MWVLMVERPIPRSISAAENPPQLTTVAYATE
jgi:hypothetical protein